MSPRRVIHPIEDESYAILRARVDTTHLPPLTRAVVERVIHTTADPTYLDDLVVLEAHLMAGLRALRSGAPLVVDTHMVQSGITTRDSLCLVRDPRAAALATAGLTRSAAGMRLATQQAGAGAVWVVGNAPTALMALLDLVPTLRPSLIVGLPVGYVGAVDAKQALRDNGVAAVTNRTEKGGTAVAAAVINALLYIEEDIA